MAFEVVIVAACWIGTLLGRRLGHCENLNRVISIRRKNSGHGFHQKDPRLRHRINQLSSGGKITAPLFLGIALAPCLPFHSTASY